MFLVIICFSNIEIDLYSFYRKNLITTPKIRRKIDRSPYSFTRKQQLISLASLVVKKIAAIFGCTNYSRTPIKWPPSGNGKWQLNRGWPLNKGSSKIGIRPFKKDMPFQYKITRKKNNGNT